METNEHQNQTTEEEQMPAAISEELKETQEAMDAGDDERIARLSLIDESGEKYVRMAHLATVGSHAVRRRRSREGADHLRRQRSCPGGHRI